MSYLDAKPILAIRPPQAFLFGLPSTCFALALLTDIIYAQTTDMMWADFSAWLLVAGLILGAIALFAALWAIVVDWRRGETSSAWIYFFGIVSVQFLSLINVFIHSRDAYTSVMPTGLILSAVVVFLMLLTMWFGGSIRRSARRR